MQNVMTVGRETLVAGLFVVLAQSGLGAPAEYKMTDNSFYARAAVLKAQPQAIILRAWEFTEKGDSYFVARHRKAAPPQVYIEVSQDWLESVTPPSMPDSLGLAVDAIQIREPRGDAQVIPSAAGSTPVPATENLPVAAGSTVKTGKDGTAAILFGGVDSARLAPDSEAVVDQTVTPQLRTTRIDLKSGIVFAKVGLRPGEKQDYEVHTPHGVAFAKGTDFACVVSGDRTDVVVVQGVVEFKQDNGQSIATVHATGKGAPRMMRFPAIADPQQALTATTQTFTALLTFIPTVNSKLKTLHDQMQQGITPSPQEKLYLTMMKRVTCLRLLTLVAPPQTADAGPATAPDLTPPPRLEATPSSRPSPLAVALPPMQSDSFPVATLATSKNQPAPRALAVRPKKMTSTMAQSPHDSAPETVIIEVAFDGSIHLAGTQLSAGHLERKLARLSHDHPHSHVVIRGNPDEQSDRIQTVIAMAHHANLTDIQVEPAVSYGSAP